MIPASLRRRNGNGNGTTVALLAVLTLLLQSPGLARAEIDFDAKCNQRRLRAIAVRAGTLIHCQGIGIRTSSTRAHECRYRTDVSFRSAWESIERSGACALLIDTDTARADAFVGFNAVLDGIPGSSATPCTLGGLKALKASAVRQLTCYADAARRRRSVDPQCIARMADTMARQYQRIHERGNCSAAANWERINENIATWNHNAVAAVSTTCGDGIAGPAEECDGVDDASCPGQCTPECFCP